MLCEKPFMIGSAPCPCIKCFPCRINRRRLWAHRILLESKTSSDSCFVTLTYSDDYVPAGATLEPKHVQDWLKRLRKLYHPQKIRYFLAGEYGEKTQRPHYHVALFGIDPWLAGGVSGMSGFVSRTWGYGYSYVGELNADSAMYIAGYCTKKMTSAKDERLNGRTPEFARMSLRPGIGAASCDDIAAALKSPGGAELLSRDGDVPSSLMHGKKRLPLGRYMRGLLRQKLGYGSREVPTSYKKLNALRMYGLRRDGLKNAKGSASVWETLYGQKIRNLKSKAAVYRKEKML